MGFIDKEQLINIAHPMEKTDYGQYLLHIAKEDEQGLMEAAATAEGK